MDPTPPKRARKSTRSRSTQATARRRKSTVLESWAETTSAVMLVIPGRRIRYANPIATNRLPARLEFLPYSYQIKLGGQR